MANLGEEGRGGGRKIVRGGEEFWAVSRPGAPALRGLAADVGSIVRIDARMRTLHPASLN